MNPIEIRIGRITLSKARCQIELRERGKEKQTENAENAFWGNDPKGSSSKSGTEIAFKFEKSRIGCIHDSRLTMDRRNSLRKFIVKTSFNRFFRALPTFFALLDSAR